jgi:hypothetical protein
MAGSNYSTGRDERLVGPDLVGGGGRGGHEIGAVALAGAAPIVEPSATAV